MDPLLFSNTDVLGNHLVSFIFELSAVFGRNTINSRFMIRHTVVFKLKCAKGSDEENEFLMAASSLSSIPGVVNFESLRQISKKNDFDFGLSMEFVTTQSYNDYNKDPDHIRFVENYWMKYVDKFLEIDYEPM